MTFPSLATMCERARVAAPVFVESFDRITQRFAGSDKSDINLKYGIGRQRCDSQSIAIGFIVCFVIGVRRGFITNVVDTCPERQCRGVQVKTLHAVRKFYCWIILEKYNMSP